MKNSIVTIALVLVALFAKGQTSLRANQFNLEDGIGIKGYDPVSYFVEHKAVKGKKEFAH